MVENALIRLGQGILRPSDYLLRVFFMVCDVGDQGTLQFVKILLNEAVFFSCVFYVHKG